MNSRKLQNSAMAIKRYQPRPPLLNYHLIFKIFISIVTSIVIILAISVAIFKVEQKNETLPSENHRRFEPFFKNTDPTISEPFCLVKDFTKITSRDKSFVGKRTSPPSCEKRRLLTSLVATENEHLPYFVEVEQDSLERWDIDSMDDLNCCMKVIERINDDSTIKLNDICEPFEKTGNSSLKRFSHNIEHIYVQCSTRVDEDEKVIYENVHTVFAINEKLVERQQRTNLHRKNNFNILLIEFNSMSRVNFRIALRNSYSSYLQDKSDWFEFTGYNRVS